MVCIGTVPAIAYGCGIICIIDAGRIAYPDDGFHSEIREKFSCTSVGMGRGISIAQQLVGRENPNGVFFSNNLND